MKPIGGAGGRLFVAVSPPDRVRDALDAFLEPRRATPSELRWVLPEAWHVTCAFLAAVPGRLVEPLGEALAAVAARTPSFNVELVGAGAFPDPDQAKALWLGFGAGAVELGQLARRCRNAAAGVGLPVAGGPFRPHLTVARARGIRASRWLTVLDAVPSQAWRVAEIALIQSWSLPGGAGYRRLGEWRLAG